MGRPHTRSEPLSGAAFGGLRHARAGASRPSRSRRARRRAGVGRTPVRPSRASLRRPPARAPGSFPPLGLSDEASWSRCRSDGRRACGGELDPASWRAAAGGPGSAEQHAYHFDIPHREALVEAAGPRHDADYTAPRARGGRGRRALGVSGWRWARPSNRRRAGAGSRSSAARRGRGPHRARGRRGEAGWSNIGSPDPQLARERSRTSATGRPPPSSGPGAGQGSSAGWTSRARDRPAAGAGADGRMGARPAGASRSTPGTQERNADRGPAAQADRGDHPATGSCRPPPSRATSPTACARRRTPMRAPGPVASSCNGHARLGSRASRDPVGWTVRRRG